jgi:hypothetical protein
MVALFQFNGSMLLFFFAQRTFFEGITLTGIKG